MIKIYVDKANVMMTIWRINITNYPLFILNILIGILATTTVFKKMPSCKWLEWTGRHCIVSYTIFFVEAFLSALEKYVINYTFLIQETTYQL